MCDVNGTRRSRRKQHTPARRPGIATAVILRVPDQDYDDSIDEKRDADVGTTNLQVEEKNYVNSDEINSTESEGYRQQAAESMQRFSPSTASSTPSSSASMDNTTILSDNCRREFPSYHCINPLHALYIPVAYHNNSVNSIQVLGYPQVVIPVAVHRHAQDITKPYLIIDEFMARNTVIPKHICFGETKCELEISNQQTHSNVAHNCPLLSSPNNVLHLDNNNRKDIISNDVEKRRLSLNNDLKPLDLTVRINHDQIRQDHSNGSNNSNCESAEEDSSLGPRRSNKKYRCDCGVSFNSEVTLNGHKRYYCNSNANQAAPFRIPQKKVAYHCQQCDFLPASASQLAQHIRINHATVQAYICQICGYRGYSKRGIRSHLRTHTECPDQKADEMLNSYVHFVAADTKTIQCSNCLRNKQK